MTPTALDHLVIAARSLDEGVAWCEATFGITPGPGGQHPLMGTHNRLVNVSSAAFARAYLEIIAIDSEAPPPGRTRWYDLDDAALQAALARGPQLIHWVARVPDLRAQLASLATAGWDSGEAVQAARGGLRWQISVRRDGTRLCEGVLPTLIEWGAQHPCDDMPASGLSLQALTIEGLSASAFDVLQTAGVQQRPAASRPRLRARFTTPFGAVEIASHPQD